MKANQKRKRQWSSRIFFGQKAASKVQVTEKLLNQPSNEIRGGPTIANRSMDGCSAESPQEKSSTAAKLRRTGSKLLSIVSFSGSSSTQAAAISSNAPSERDVTIAIPKGSIIASTTSQSSTNALVDLGELEISSENGIASPMVIDRSTSRTSPLGPAASIETVVTGDLGFFVEDTLMKRIDHSSLRKSLSAPGLAHQLSHKISTTFGNPTVVHRPNLRSRPSIHSIHGKPTSPKLSGDQEPRPHDSTAPSSFNSGGSISPSGRSTGKTSVDSNVGPIRCPKTRDRNEKQSHLGRKLVVESRVPEKSLTPIEETPVEVTPTVTTVETTANAKIFFETHFNLILSGQLSPRSLRRHDLEIRLKAGRLSAEQRQQERAVWASTESEHLRRDRVLKSKTNEMIGSAGVAVAGYEVVRVLGKGSFGVVRLVREKELVDDDLLSQSSTPTPGPSWRQSPREELNNLKMTAIEALKSSLDGQRTPQRRDTRKAKREVYAMKVIRKSDMLRNSQEGHIRAERDFLVASESSRWVVPLIASFQDANNLYLVMEYMVGGDFLGLLFRKDILKEKKAKWYIAEMILCVEEAHKLCWIHRDVKPDNFLISASGHLKISDFGLAFDGHWAHDQSYFNSHRVSLMEKLGIVVDGDSIDRKEGASIAAGMSLANVLMGRKERHEKAQLDGPAENETILQWRDRNCKRKLARSVVGTSQYMAPEVIRGELYDGRCDWWSIGIILYECLYGFTPFVCDTRVETKAKILANATTLRFPSEQDLDRRDRVTYDAMDLINSLLQEKEHRICSQKYKFNDYQHSKRIPGQLMTARANTQSVDYQGHYVYADDATDIKVHPFFHGLAWDRLHLSRPPFVPDVKSRDDTRYFDEDEPISDVDDASSSCSAPNGPDLSGKAVDVAGLAGVAQVDGAHVPQEPGFGDGLASMVARTEGGAINDAVTAEGTKAKKARREKKRPRDMVLRDKEVGRKVLDLRKKGAFLGYAYRRPLASRDDEDRGRQGSSRKS